METAVRTRAEELFTQVESALAELVELPIAMPVGPTDALEALRRVEVVARQARAAQVAVADAVERSEVWKRDGHRHGHQMVGRACRLSNAEQLRRDRSVRALRDLPCVAGGLRSGRLGAPQVERIARTWANPRVRATFVEMDATVAELAAKEPYDVLDRLLADWEATTDETGAADAATRAHRDRDATVGQDLDGGWAGSFRCGTLDGAQVHDIFDAFCRAELEVDWACAREQHGDEATASHLARTAAQRRFDALARIFRTAADGRVAAGGSVIETIVVVDEETFDRHLRRLAGQRLPAPRLDLHGGHLDPPGPPGAPDGQPPDPAGQPDDLDGWASLDPPVPLADIEASLAWRDEELGGHRRRRYRCHTLDGHRIDPTEAVANAITSHVRRAVVDAASVTIDLGRRQRLFAGHASLAARLAATTCYWPGCRAPASRCQIDHLDPWAAGGRTDQVNGGLACGHHNRLKEHGYTVQRGADGTIHIHHPDGRRIE